MPRGYRYGNRTSEELDLQDRLLDTTTGQVPLRRGKYGMDVEEFLEWKSKQQLKYRFERVLAFNDATDRLRGSDNEDS